MMKASLVAVVSILTAITICPILLAQWPDYPTPNVPLLSNGQPNLEAPAPRTADGKPDLSGIWAAGRGGGGGGRGGQRGQRGAEGGARGAAPAATPAAPPAAAPAANAGPPNATFFDIGAGIPGGPPFQP